jgi:hypothetical protein
MDGDRVAGKLRHGLPISPEAQIHMEPGARIERMVDQRWRSLKTLRTRCNFIKEGDYKLTLRSSYRLMYYGATTRRVPKGDLASKYIILHKSYPIPFSAKQLLYYFDRR